MASYDLTAADAVLKEIYSQEGIENIATRNRTWLGKVPKKDIFTGDLYVQPLMYSNVQGRSATFATAQTNATASKTIKWTGTRKKDYSVATIDGETLRATRDRRGSFVEALKNETDSMFDALGHSASVALYGSGGGSIGVIATGGVSGATITLTNVTDSKNFFPGQVVVCDTVDGTGTVNAGSCIVLSVAPDTGIITMTDTVTNGISSAQAADFVFVSGDYGAKMTGLAGWLPLAAPAATTFFGVDRTLDTERLGGVRLDNTSGSIEENMLTVGERLVNNGSKPDIALLNHSNFSTLVKGLGSKVQFTDFGGKASFGFRGVVMHTSAGMFEVFPDPDCPANRGYVLQKDTWLLAHLDAFPHFIEDDGKKAQRQATSDGIEVRARYMGQLFCKAPGLNAVFSI